MIDFSYLSNANSPRKPILVSSRGEISRNTTRFREQINVPKRYIPCFTITFQIYTQAGMVSGCIVLTARSRKGVMNVPPALLSDLCNSESSRSGLRIIPQRDRRQEEGRRSDWRGGRRVRDFSRFDGMISPDSAPPDNDDLPQATAEGLLH